MSIRRLILFMSGIGGWLLGADSNPITHFEIELIAVWLVRPIFRPLSNTSPALLTPQFLSAARPRSSELLRSGANHSPEARPRSSGLSRNGSNHSPEVSFKSNFRCLPSQPGVTRGESKSPPLIPQARDSFQANSFPPHLFPLPGVAL